MNYLLGPLIERIVVLYAVGGRDPLPEDVKVAAEWNYRIWRHSGRATEIELPKEQCQPRWPTPAWMLDEMCWYVLGIASAAIALVVFCFLAWG